ncbi:PIG-L family deacetylase [Comamonas terrae]|uniref:PIG-L family deacetylase n=1 Tax=Comamonas terrae TaxID=673548 RepID=A0ABW5URV5_9BURK|nr:PIG-L family deacetylase [Comamonas terrae]
MANLQEKSGKNISSLLLVFSPHLDDAVFSCGELMARCPGASVATVFAAAPSGFPSLTGWDKACGFKNAQEAVFFRREEDLRALAVLKARPSWMDFCDDQYQASPSFAELSHAVDEILRIHATYAVLLPAGLFHADHLQLHDALLSLHARYSERTWIMYEDALYRRIPGLLQRRLATLHSAGFCATPLSMPQDMDARELKREAVCCYASQLRALDKAANGHADACAPEGYWLLETGLASEEGAG